MQKRAVSSHKVELRCKIQEAAAASFIQEGYDNVSMRKIADRIGYAPSTIYLYFRNKFDLVSNICTAVFAELDQRLDVIVAMGLPPMQTLRRCLRQYVQFGLEHPSHYGFVFCTPLSVLQEMDAASHEALNKCGSGFYLRLHKVVQACIDSGDIPAGDAGSVSHTTWLLTHGITSGLFVDRGFRSIERERLVEESLDHILRGLTGR